MENMNSKICAHKELKEAFEALERKKSDLESEQKRLEGLKSATQAEIDNSVKSRREFIESGGDVFDQQAKNLRKSEVENAAIIEDIGYAIEVVKNALGNLHVEMSKRFSSLEMSRRGVAMAMIDDRVEKVRESAMNDLLIAAHLAAVFELEDKHSLDVLQVAAGEKPTYENVFYQQLRKILSQRLRELATREAGASALPEEDVSLLRIPRFKAMSPTQIHLLKKGGIEAR